MAKNLQDTGKQEDFAIIASGGKQYRVTPGAKIRVEKLEAEAGKEVVINDVLLVKNNSATKVGSPLVEGASVGATVLSHGRGDKKIIFKKRRRKGYRLKKGHRQDYTELLIQSIS